MVTDKFSNAEIKKWGLFHKLEKERLKDQLLLDRRVQSPERVDEIKADWCKFHGITTKDDLSIWLEAHKLNEKEWIDFLIRNWMWQDWCADEYISSVSSYYLKRKSSLDQVTYSLIRVKNKQLANELYLRIKEGEDPFWKVAKDFSEGLERNTEGRVGPVPSNRPHPILARMLQASKEGQLWPPKEVEGWWIIIRLEKKHLAKLSKEITQKLSLELGELHLEKILDIQYNKQHDKN